MRARPTEADHTGKPAMAVGHYIVCWLGTDQEGRQHGRAVMMPERRLCQKDSDRAMTDSNLTGERAASNLAEEVDLYDRLMKGRYEIGAAEQASPPQ